jgi:hypothetical protein
MNEPIKHDNKLASPKDGYRRAARQIDLLRCKLCGSRAELYQRWVRDDVWETYGSCTNDEDVDGEPCQFGVPESSRFYSERRVEAARYWNLMMGPRLAAETKACACAGAWHIPKITCTACGTSLKQCPECRVIAGHRNDCSAVEPHGDLHWKPRLEETLCHPDPTGKTREPPHCPTCSCATDGELPAVI